jgi:hypothetical protein
MSSEKHPVNVFSRFRVNSSDSRALVFQTRRRGCNSLLTLHFLGVIAQTAERLFCKQKVAGATPADSTIFCAVRIRLLHPFEKSRVRFSRRFLFPCSEDTGLLRRLTVRHLTMNQTMGVRFPPDLARGPHPSPLFSRKTFRNNSSAGRAAVTKSLSHLFLAARRSDD